MKKYAQLRPRDNRGRFIREDNEIIKSCLRCKKIFKIFPYRLKTANFCSILCRNKTIKSYFWLGKKRAKKTSIKISKTLKRKGIKPKIRFVGIGKNHWNWQGGITYSRWTDEYKKLIKKIYQRDNYTCQICGNREGKINVDHIKPWVLYPELRFDPQNLRTLCIECHLKTDTWGRRVWTTRNQNVEI